ncbi:MAG: IS3 family transposase, partial [Chloroflexota bacterium]
MQMRKQYSATFKAQIVHELLREEKTVAQVATEYGIHPTQLHKWRSIAVEGLPELFRRSDSTAQIKARYEEQLEELYAQLGRVTTQLAWLKRKSLASNLARTERQALLEREAGELSVRVQADLLGLNRSTLYYQPVPPSAEEVALKHRIDELYTAHPYYGSRRVAAVLRREGGGISRKAVQRQMREMGIAGIAPGPQTSRRAAGHAVYPYLLRSVTSVYPNHIWGIDITYIRLQAGWMYLVAVLDWYSRFVVSWELDQTLELPFVLRAARRALAGTTPTIWNSDQGSHFTSPQYLALLQAAEVRISMDGKGRALDNIFTERLWRTVKYEEVYLHSYESPRQARQGLSQYLAFYNQERPHQALGYRTPAEVYHAAPAIGP